MAGFTPAGTWATTPVVRCSAKQRIWPAGTTAQVRTKCPPVIPAAAAGRALPPSSEQASAESAKTIRTNRVRRDSRFLMTTFRLDGVTNTPQKSDNKRVVVEVPLPSSEEAYGGEVDVLVRGRLASLRP